MAETNTAKSFWDSVKSFPLGMYCQDFRYDWRMTSLPKDCGTCRLLSFGRCSRDNIPTKDVELKQKP